MQYRFFEEDDQFPTACVGVTTLPSNYKFVMGITISPVVMIHQNTLCPQWLSLFIGGYLNSLCVHNQFGTLQLLMGPVTCTSNLDTLTPPTPPFGHNFRVSFRTVGLDTASSASNAVVLLSAECVTREQDLPSIRGTIPVHTRSYTLPVR